MCHITAKATFNDHELNDIRVINPGDWFGKTRLLEVGGSYTPLFLIVEADSVQDAIEELADNERYGHHIIVDEADLSDYDPDDCHYGPSGQVLDVDHLMIHGREDIECPFPCTYFGDDLPEQGMKPTDYYCREEDGHQP